MRFNIIGGQNMEEKSDENLIENLLINFIDNNKMMYDVKTDETDNNIIYGDRGQSFKNMIRSILLISRLKQEYIDVLLDDYSISIYDIVFTHKSANSLQNYELYEMLGDTTVNKSIAWYLPRRFKDIWNDPDAVEKLSKTTQKLRSKKSLSSISKSIDFWDFITADQTSRKLKRTDILEDVFEAFIGGTEFLLDKRIKQGVGYTVCYAIIKSIFDSQDISMNLDVITDPISRLKETFDSKDLKEKGIGVQEVEAIAFNDPEKKWIIYIYRKDKKGNKTLLAQSTDFKKKNAQYKASVYALQKLKEMGFEK